MATTTKISDIIEPAVYLKYQKEYNPVKYEFVNSGVFGSPHPELTTQMTAGGSTVDMPFWQDTNRNEPAGQTDDDTVSITADKFTAQKLTARKMYWAKRWSQSNLAGAFATGNVADPLRQVADYTERYWRSTVQLTSIKILQGVLADNIANDSSDMLYNIYSDIATPLAANKVSPAALTSARLTMGDFMDDVGIIMCHSKVYGDMLNQENITFVQPSDLPFKISMYAGMRVVVSDDCPVSTGFANTPKYTSFLFGAGAMQMAMHFPENAVRTFTDEDKGNGGGVDNLYNRRHCLIHPDGFRFTSSSVAGKSPTWAELATAGNWDRKYQRKNIKIAFLTTN